MPIKVLILCKDFPPSNKIGGKRPCAWFKYLPEFGVDATVITATLDPGNVESDGLHRVDCNTNHLNNYANRTSIQLLSRKTRSFFELWLPYIFPRVSRFWKVYKKADELLSNTEVDYIIATADPFILFNFACKLSKKHGIPWIPDYRDNWSNEPTTDPDSLNALRFQHLYRPIERKLLQSTKNIITVGTQTAARIKEIYSKNEVHIIENGHDIPLGFENRATPSDRLRITHIGRLYKHRDPSLFLNGVIDWKKNNSDKSIEILFIGLDDFPNQKNELLKTFEKSSAIIKSTPSMEYTKMLKLASESHAFLLLADPQLPLTNGKIYDYLGLRRPIILIPDDKSVFNHIIQTENCGFTLSNSFEVSNLLDMFYENKSNPDFFSTNVDSYKYSRKNGAKKLAEILKTITK